MAMAMPFANNAGKFATLATVRLPPVLFVAPVPEVKSNNHCVNGLGFGNHNGQWEILTSVLSFSTLRRANRVGAFWSPSKSCAVLVALVFSARAQAAAVRIERVKVENFMVVNTRSGLENVERRGVGR